MLIAALATVCLSQDGLHFTTVRPKKPGQTVVLPTKEDLSQPAIELKGDDKLYDFRGMTLQGSDLNVEPDKRKGLGILVTGKNVTIKNLKVRGYKVALKAVGCTNLKIVDSDFSYNWKQHLGSTLEKEDLNDWMSYHQNEKDEWLRYGAAMYFKDVKGFEVKGVKAVGGQCGLMLMRSSDGLIWNNNFSFLSGVGLGLYRSSNNRVMHNNIDYCVRGYSHGVYNRGQDSAGILIFEQCNKNIFAYNSVTHGGDGFFLWAGQQTMDSGKGGCNDNLLFGNDFSYAPTNGIEATFSRNKFINNRLEECWHGFWTGYSYDSLIAGNFISGCEEGIAHEHGQSNRVEFNNFLGNKTDIHIWANATQDPNWGYPKNRDTKSRDWVIVDNTFYTGVKDKTLRVNRTNGLTFGTNTVFGGAFEIAADVTGVKFLDTCIHGDPNTVKIPTLADAVGTKFEAPAAQTMVPQWDPFDREDVYKSDSPELLKGGKRPFLSSSVEQGRKTIMVDEWGPYDFLSPKLWPGPVAANGAKKYSVYGPKGTWKLISAKGVDVSSKGGQVPGSFTMKSQMGSSEQELIVEYTGKAFVDYKGVQHAAGKPYRMTIRRFDLPIDWHVKFFPFDLATQDPRTKRDGYDKAAENAKIEVTRTKLDYAGYGKFEAGVPNNHFGTIAQGTFEIKPGDYTIDLTADDGVRAWLDGKLIVDEWHYQGPTTYSVKRKLGGKHNLKIEHFQLDGYSALQLKIRPN